MVKHLTDDEVQQFALDKLNCEMETLEHIQFCRECKTKAEVYRVMITGIKHRSQPAFEFDLSAAVLHRLPLPQTKTSSDRGLIWLFIIIGIGITGGTIYLFQGSFAYLFYGLTAILIYLISISSIAILAGLFFDMYKNYEKEMKLLDSY